MTFSTIPDTSSGNNTELPMSQLDFSLCIRYTTLLRLNPQISFRRRWGTPWFNAANCSDASPTPSRSHKHRTRNCIPPKQLRRDLP
jgi:hypothetical protein